MSKLASDKKGLNTLLPKMFSRDSFQSFRRIRTERFFGVRWMKHHLQKWNKKAISSTIYANANDELRFWNGRGDQIKMTLPKSIVSIKLVIQIQYPILNSGLHWPLFSYFLWLFKQANSTILKRINADNINLVSCTGLLTHSLSIMSLIP